MTVVADIKGAATTATAKSLQQKNAECPVRRALFFIRPFSDPGSVGGFETPATSLPSIAHERRLQ